MKHRESEQQILEHLRHLLQGLNQTLEAAHNEHGLNLVVSLIDERTNHDYCDQFVQQIRIKLVTDIA